MWSNQEVNVTLRASTNDELHGLNKAIIAELNRRRRINAANFSVGDEVEFTIQKNKRHQGETWRGTVKRVNVKSLSVSAIRVGYSDSPMKWQVSPDLVHKINEDRSEYEPV